MIAGQEVIFEPPDFERRLYREVCTKVVLRIIIIIFLEHVKNCVMMFLRILILLRYSNILIIFIIII